jgi:hypothetical protein
MYNPSHLGSGDRRITVWLAQTKVSARPYLRNKPKAKDSNGRVLA